jgi:hypothetical protein
MGVLPRITIAASSGPNGNGHHAVRMKHRNSIVSPLELSIVLFRGRPTSSRVLCARSWRKAEPEPWHRESGEPQILGQARPYRASRFLTHPVRSRLVRSQKTPFMERFRGERLDRRGALYGTALVLEEFLNVDTRAECYRVVVSSIVATHRDVPRGLW